MLQHQAEGRTPHLIRTHQILLTLVLLEGLVCLVLVAMERLADRDGIMNVSVRLERPAMHGKGLRGKASEMKKIKERRKSKGRGRRKGKRGNGKSGRPFGSKINVSGSGEAPCPLLLQRLVPALLPPDRLTHTGAILDHSKASHPQATRDILKFSIIRTLVLSLQLLPKTLQTLPTRGRHQ